MSSTQPNLTNLVREITYYYIQHYYNDLLKKKGVNKVPNDELREFINTMYTEKQADIKKYIRESLKEQLGSGYSIAVTENIILEMFKDPEYAKARVYNEIVNYQNSQNL